jgi:transcriptional regulator with XRE-family HTH domain
MGRIGAEIRRRRERKKLSVQQAADAAGVLAPSWYQWESGRHIPLDRLPAIAYALHCKARDLIPRE